MACTVTSVLCFNPILQNTLPLTSLLLNLFRANGMIVVIAPSSVEQRMPASATARTLNRSTLLPPEVWIRTRFTVLQNVLLLNRKKIFSSPDQLIPEKAFWLLPLVSSHA